MRKSLGLFVVLMMTASGVFVFGNAEAVVSTSSEEDFESPSGMSGWTSTVGTGNVVGLSEAAYASPVDSLHIVKGVNSNLARATSPKIALDYWSDYTLSLKFMLPNVTENAMLLVDDGRIYVTVSTIGSTLLRFYCPTLSANIPVAQGAWHWLTLQVHPVVGGSGSYDVILDGVAVDHNKGFKAGPTMTIATGTDASTSRKVNGELYIDDIKYNGNPGAYLDDLNDGSISDWTTSVGRGSLVEVSTSYPASTPYGLHVYYLGTMARATTPSIPCDFSADYYVQFYFFAVSGAGPMIAYDDGMIELRVVSQTLYAKNSAGTYTLVGALTSISPPMHKFSLHGEPSLATPSFSVAVDGASLGVFEMKSGTAAGKITVGSDPSPSKKDSGHGYWDDFAVSNGPLVPDTDHDGLFDVIEVGRMGTDPYGSAKWAILLSGGSQYQPDLLSQPSFEWQIDQAILVLQCYGFTDSSIQALSLTRTFSDPDGDGINDIDGTSSRTNLQSSVEYVAARSDADDVVFIYLVDHGDAYGSGGITYGRINIGPENLLDSELASWTSQISCRLMVVVIDCCNSGLWIDDFAGPGRMVFTAANSGGVTNAGDPFTGTFFSEPFFQAIGQGESLEDAFDYSTRRIDENTRYHQYPVMSDWDTSKECYIWE